MSVVCDTLPRALSYVVHLGCASLILTVKTLAHLST